MAREAAQGVGRQGRAERTTGYPRRERGFVLTSNARELRPSPPQRFTEAPHQTSYGAEDSGKCSTTVDQAKEQRLADLERLLSEYKSGISELEAELDAIGGNPSSLGSGKTREQLQSEIEESNTKIEALETGAVCLWFFGRGRSFGPLDLSDAEGAVEGGLAKVEELEQKLFDLGWEIGAGRQIPPGIRVLTFKDNPAQQEVDLRQATLDRLKGENEALLKKLAELGSGGCDTDALSVGFVPKESWEVMKMEKAELTSALEHKEKRIKRLQEVPPLNLTLHIRSLTALIDLCEKERRVPRSGLLNPRVQARLQSEWHRPDDVSIRPERRIRVQASDERGRDLNSTGRTGRRRTGRPTATDATLVGGGTMYAGIHGERDAGMY